VAAESGAVKSHRRAVVSSPPVTSQWVSWLKAAALIDSVWPVRTTEEIPKSGALCKSHRRAVTSLPPVTSQRPSGLIAKALTGPSCPDSMVAIGAGLFEFDASAPIRSHRRSVASSLAATSHRLSGPMATSLIAQSSWPGKTMGAAAGSGALRSHKRAVRSALPVPRADDKAGNYIIVAV
jgi:hypothetical protein